MRRFPCWSTQLYSGALGNTRVLPDALRAGSGVDVAKCSWNGRALPSRRPGQRDLLPRHVFRTVASMAVGESLVGDHHRALRFRAADVRAPWHVDHGVAYRSVVPAAHRRGADALPAFGSPLVRTSPRVMCAVGQGPPYAPCASQLHDGSQS